MRGGETGGRRVWLFTRGLYMEDGPRVVEEVGIFSSPEEAFEVARCHPDFEDIRIRWGRIPWEDGEVAYRAAFVRPYLDRDGPAEEPWELWLVPFVLDRPLFDFVEDEAVYRRLRYGGNP